MRALVLAGGGMRGAYTSGVLDVLAESGPTFDAVYGTSAGGGNGAWFTARQTADCIRSWRYAQDPRILSYRRWLTGRGPMLDLDTLLFDVYPNELGFDAHAVEKSRHPMIVTATHVDTGRTHYLDLRQVPVLDGLRATSALPFATGPPVRVAGGLYLDGGLSDPVPIVKALRDGADEIVVVLNNFKAERRSEPAALSWWFARQYPRLAAAGRQHHAIINDAVHLAENPPEGIQMDVIRPSRDTRLTRMTRDLALLNAAIELGRTDARAYLA